MKKKQKLVKRLGHIGSGSEAKVYIEIRKFFPGIGGDIHTTQRLACANREDLNPVGKKGHLNFLRHAIIKKLDDYFCIQEKYGSAHIPRPLGSDNKSHIYEFVSGSEGFPWELFDGQTRNPVHLEEWGSFTGAFISAGINFSLDITDSDDGRISQNIIANHPYSLDYSNPWMSELWMRIDFGSRSISMNYNQLEKFLYDNKKKLISSLSAQRYEFLNLALQYLKEGPKKMEERDIGKLEVLTGEFRISTLGHLNKRGFSSDFTKKCGIYPTDQRL